MEQNTPVNPKNSEPSCDNAEAFSEQTVRRAKRYAPLFLAVCILLLGAVLLLFLRKPSDAPDASTEAAPALAAEAASDADTVDRAVFELLPDPTPAPEPFIRFDEAQGDAFLADGYRHELGTAYTLGGTVVSNYPIQSVTVTFTCAYNNDTDPYPYNVTVHPAAEDALSFSLRDANTKEKLSLADSVNFRSLLTGIHTVKLTVTTSAQKKEELLRVRFYVLGTEWHTWSKKEFGNSYDEALAFFKDPERFNYRYQPVNGRYTLADPDWEQTYITTMPGLPEGSNWSVHIDAVPYLTEAIDYLNTSLVRVHGTNGDSGILRASELVSEYNGAFVSRFTSSLKTVSHHSFGAAIDLNASMTPNKNTHENKTLIDDDVKKHLTYNGILYEDGLPYYDFTYDGEYETESHGVPQTCVNYIIYELGFYRAGFLWAHYYSTTSDAMHFTLSEQVSGATHDGKKGLRKVFAYALPVPLTSVAEDEAEAPAEEDTTSEALPSEATSSVS